MPRSPLLIAAAAVAALLGWSAHLGLDPAPLAAGPAAVLGVTLAGAAVVIGSAILISRARWARPATGAAALAGLALAALTPLDPGAIAAAALSAVAFAGALGPWLGRWLRRLPGAESPPRSAATALAVLALLPALVAALRFDGLTLADWVLVGAAAAAGLALSRAWPAGLWAARVGVPAAGLAAAISAGWPDGPVLGLLAATAALPAWAPGVVLSVQPILPGRGAVPIPPELVDPAMLQAAGYDDRGRR